MLPQIRPINWLLLLVLINTLLFICVVKLRFLFKATLEGQRASSSNLDVEKIKLDL